MSLLKSPRPIWNICNKNASKKLNKYPIFLAHFERLLIVVTWKFILDEKPIHPIEMTAETPIVSSKNNTELTFGLSVDSEVSYV